MANIQVRSNGGGGRELAQRREWDPTAWARELLRWDPFREMLPSSATPELTFNPAFEVKETKEGYSFKADLPGLAEKDIEVTRTGNRLVIGGKREAEREEKGDTYYTFERTYGSFQRAFTLPDGIDAEHINAELKDGVLNVLVPKLPEAQPKKIEIKPEVKKS
jgi:HSP20 family protein